MLCKNRSFWKFPGKHRCFLVKSAKFLRTPNLKNIWEQVLLHLNKLEGLEPVQWNCPMKTYILPNYCTPYLPELSCLALSEKINTREFNHPKNLKIKISRNVSLKVLFPLNCIFSC